MIMFIHELDCSNFIEMYLIKIMHLNNHTGGIYKAVVDVLSTLTVSSANELCKSSTYQLKEDYQ